MGMPVRAGFVAAALCVLSSCVGEDGVRLIKLGHGLPTSHPVHKAMTFLAERASERSNGALRIDIHPNEQLGTERECIELLQIGSLGMTKVSASVLEGFVPVYAVFSLPYIFRDEAHQFAVYDGEVGQRILLAGEPFGLRGLTYYDAGSRSFYTKDHPIEHPADLEGMKIRTQESNLAMRTIQSLGGSATPIAWGELYTALQQGVVDGAENNPPSFHLSRHYEVCPYYSLDEHTSTPDVLLIGTSLWGSLSAEEQRIVEEAAAESALLQRKLWKEATEEALQAVLEAGVTILRPDKRPFAEAVEPVYQEYRSDRELFGFAEEIRDVK
jgi:tripartite ATP-independent transporter DctP family solute receptor